MCWTCRRHVRLSLPRHVSDRKKTGPPVQTTEGTKPLLEVIAMLKTTKPLEPMESKEGMQQAAADHVK